MEILEEVQDKLKCSECDELLSCGPVYLLHETRKTICGRCSQQPNKNNRTRNDPYEAVASLLSFPCINKSRGCRKKLNFTIGQSSHELSCKFRSFICPIVPRGSCDWIGTSQNLKQHCHEKHKLNMLKNPCQPPRPDLTKSNLQTYLISAFHFLFLLHVKVCMTSGKLFHSLRLFGDMKYLDKFTFSLDIEGNNKKLTTSGLVLPPGFLMIQEPTAICTKINYLLGILDGKYDDVKLSINIQTSLNTCLKFHDDLCQKCEEKCRQGCSFVDINRNKCEKHENLFCVNQSKCVCQVKFLNELGTLKNCRKTIKTNINCVVRLTPETNFNYILFSCDLICRFKLSNSMLELRLYASLPYHELKYYKCSIKLSDPLTNNMKVITPEIIKKYWDDWLIYEKINDFPSWENIGIDMKINFDKNEISS